MEGDPWETLHDAGVNHYAVGEIAADVPKNYTLLLINESARVRTMQKRSFAGRNENPPRRYCF